MKLKNKKTGEIGYLIGCKDLEECIVANNEYACCDKYDSLAKLNAEWEDYEEPKEYWAIDCFSTDGNIVSQFTGGSDIILENRKSIGNYFETKEEAEKAVEKLKAVKRLKDKGISFEVKVIDRKWYLAPKAEQEYRTFDEAHDMYKDIMFIFGGEE